MIKLISSQGCGKCKVAQARLDRAGIPYNSQLLTKLPLEEQDLIRETAKAQGQRYFPVVLNEKDEVIDLEVVIDEYNTSENS